MAWNPFQDISNTKPLFLAVYTTVLVGIVFSTVYVVSSLYPGKLVYSEAWSSSPPLSLSGALNVGIFLWRPTDSSKKLAKEWKEMLLADETIWDQNGFNELMHRSLGPSVDGEPGLVYAFDGNLKMGILPASIFCSGHTYFVQEVS